MTSKLFGDSTDGQKQATTCPKLSEAVHNKEALMERARAGTVLLLLITLFGGSSISQAEHREPKPWVTYLKVIDTFPTSFRTQSNGRHIVACVFYGERGIAYDRQAEVFWVIRKEGQTVYSFTTSEVSLLPGEENCTVLNYLVRESHGPGQYRISGSIRIPIEGQGMVGMGGSDWVTVDLP